MKKHEKQFFLAMLVFISMSFPINLLYDYIRSLGYSHTIGAHAVVISTFICAIIYALVVKRIFKNVQQVTKNQ